MMEASFNGTIRTILVLVAAWFVIRLVMRSRQGESRGERRTDEHSDPQADRRAKGDVRVERIDGKGDVPERPIGPVEDAEFEELR
ncbi:MAG: hypothetical protein R2815_13450 [Flavobacteriales bacterium]